MKGREDAQRGYLDVEALAGELLVPAAFSRSWPDTGDGCSRIQ